ncbi:serine hydrolase domain-containing protein [Henriciella aquimarina]|uniref:serine hydrolase domain-containing protein n=1 Tax=Henriciella aquimarina TaxID=545261 RepID=UPI0009FFE81E|nr:serine hydrolase domain-containing protein [Henriciella aquimarina]
MIGTKAMLYVSVALAAGAAAAQASPQGDTMETRIGAPEAQCVLETYSAATMPGVSAAIATDAGVVWTGVSEGRAGEADRPVNEASLFPLGSITKVYVSTIVLQLVGEGQLSLDDTVADRLGDQAEGIANAGTATVANLLNHTSGIPSWEDNPDWIRKGRGAEFEASHHWAPAETLDYVRGTPALFPAGERYAYSNTDHTLLGLIVEAVTGTAVTEQLDRRIRGPLGLTETWLEGHEAAPDVRRAPRFHYDTQAFHEAAGGLPPGSESLASGLFTASQTNLSTEWAAGGMVATAREVAAFGWALASGALLEPDQQAVLETFREVDAPWAAEAYGPGGRISTGHGVFDIGTDSFEVFGHGGDVLGGSAALFWNREEGFAVALLTNVGSMHTGGQPSAGQVFFSNPLLRQMARAWGRPVSQAETELQAFLEASCN